MDEDSLRNWGYYEPPVKGHLGLQLMSSVAAERDTKPFLPGRDHNPVMVPSNGSYHPRDCIVTNPPVTHMDYVRDSWINHCDKFPHMLSRSPYSPVLADTSAAGPHQSMQMVVHTHQQPETRSSIEEPFTKKEDGPGLGPGPSKKRGSAPKAPKAKKPRRGPGPKENGNNGSNSNTKNNKDSNSNNSTPRAKKNVEVVINGVDMDITGIPIPVCSCTGAPQQCYRWGCGGWQSACCTTTISMYPLPMSTKRRGARIAGRKMSQGAFKKVLEKLAGEGYNFANPIDLRTYWAKHGTNKFVIIR
ncbi:Protein BASIC PENTACYSTEINE1 [Striga hermonthica]|uniref:GAGA-binding transcriptional activator n=1 Tax=Striga hermonthica TaxID=68872 RepID=A0A9N7MHV4_STRHE|nr:Protein BASIC PENTACYSTEINE1 [Striga hermonthica]